MDDFLFYSLLGAFLVGVLFGASQDAPSCQGECSQGRKACNCARREV